MKMKKAKLIFKHNYFEVIEEGEYVLCAVSGKQIPLQNLNYWNVDLQESYYSPIEVNEKLKLLKNRIYFHLLCDQIHSLGFFYHIFKSMI